MAKKQFKAESKRLLDLMINSIYTHQEIFLREIISNASDAIDKLAYQALTDEKVGLSRSDFAIELKPDETARTLTVSDNGIGMGKDEMENNLGTICRSGSLQFKQALDKEKAADTDIIGQFGVGFYSAFMVADKVTVISKKYGSDEAWKWESEGADGYTMTPCERESAGTDVIMQLKADTDDEKYSRFLKTWALAIDGSRTTDAAQAFRGILLPLGYKGYGMAVIVDMLSGVLNGSGFGVAVDTPKDKPIVGSSFLAIKTEAFCEQGEFRRNVDALIDEIKNVKLEAGTDEVLMPGEIEFRAEIANRKKGGVPIQPFQISELNEQAAPFGFTFEEYL